jgi:hypothetical protein
MALHLWKFVETVGGEMHGQSRKAASKGREISVSSDSANGHYQSNCTKVHFRADLKHHMG